MHAQQLYSLDIRRTRHQRGPDAIDETNLLYHAFKIKGQFRQFVPLRTLLTHRDWQDAIEGLEAICVSLAGAKSQRDRQRWRQAHQLCCRIADMLVTSEPIEVESEPETEDVPEGCLF